MSDWKVKYKQKRLPKTACKLNIRQRYSVDYLFKDRKDPTKRLKGNSLELGHHVLFSTVIPHQDVSRVERLHTLIQQCASPNSAHLLYSVIVYLLHSVMVYRNTANAILASLMWEWQELHAACTQRTEPCRRGR